MARNKKLGENVGSGRIAHLTDKSSTASNQTPTSTCPHHTDCMHYTQLLHTDPPRMGHTMHSSTASTSLRYNQSPQ